MGLWMDGDSGPTRFPNSESYTWLHRSHRAAHAAVFAPNRVQKRTNDKQCACTHTYTHREGGQEGNKINNWGSGVRGIQDFLGVFVCFWLFWQLSSNCEIISK